MKTGILFDLDGTLLDTLEDLRDGVNYALTQRGYPTRSLKEIRTFVGNGARNLITRSLPENPTEEQIDSTLAVFQGYYKDHCQIKTRPYPGVLEALTQISETYPIAIVSNKPDGATKALCAQYFPGVFALGERPGCTRKPAPDMLYAAMKEIGVEKCVYVGDSEVDVLTAQNTGVPCLSVTWGFRDMDVLTAAGGCHFCQAPQDLPTMLTALIGETHE